MKTVVVKLVTDTVWDYAALVLQLCVTVLLLALTTYVCLVVDRLRSVVVRDILMTSCITACCIIWMWSAFVSDLHFGVFLWLTQQSCVLWDFWLQYAAGLNAVLSFIIVKLSWHKHTQDHRLSVHIRNHTLLLIMVCVLPVIIVCAAVEYNDGVSVEESSGSCHTQMGWKYALIGCLLTNYLWLMYLIISGLRYKYVTREYRELLYGACVASAALLTILVLNLTHQTVYVYGRILKCLCINCASTSLFLGIMGIPIIHSLKRRNEYELAMHIKDTEIQHSSQIKSLVDLLPYSNAYQNYLSWLIQRYSEKKDLLTLERSNLAPVLIPQQLQQDDDVVKEMQWNTQLCSNDPQIFLFHPMFIVKLIQRLDLAISSGRSPDIEWKQNIERAYIRNDASSHVRLPYNLQQMLIHSATDDVCNYKNLLLCTKLWLLAQLERLTWTDYVLDVESGLPAWIKIVKSPQVQEYLLDSEQTFMNDNEQTV